MVENPAVRIIDASSAHRTAPDWVFGFPELEPAATTRSRWQSASAIPAAMRPVSWRWCGRWCAQELFPPDFPLTVNAVSGYSGGGKAMIEEFEGQASPRYVETVCALMALTLAHKHVPEMQMHAGLAHPPVFAPSVGRFYRGMIVEVPLQLWALPGSRT